MNANNKKHQNIKSSTIDEDIPNLNKKFSKFHTNQYDEYKIKEHKIFHKTTINSDGIDRKADATNQQHSRKKRLIWITDDGRLALPPGTVLSIAPTLSLPLVRYPPEGFLSNLTMSFPLTSKSS